MLAQAITVGTTAVVVPVTTSLQLGLRLLARDANTGSVYVGTSSAVTTATGKSAPEGEPGRT